VLRLAAERRNLMEVSGEGCAIQIRDRVNELRLVKAHDLVPHSKNWGDRAGTGTPTHRTA
jgi:hypothetical protein